ncbi:anthranilate synthase component I [Haloarcula salinisoli]|uniref:Anthranilate synthase component 1 n=1 Tax=Haloarcula salinisoli TaxID=2487746 RepID=A0A8J7YGC6_9EURY|nr:anthranilate synthase component I [Halomicroarcula salinisoli]MBX0287445.1 anthranilate synthase component I [Halomicroarcula salinisoli]MBX0304982.1 anthranilate synthase component I [Halomicroarcula salinisoli]
MNIDISREEFIEHAEADRPVVVRAAADLDVDLEPLAAYAALSGRTSDATESDYTFLLESAEKVASSDPDGAFAPETDDRHARFSFVGYDPRAVVTVTGDESEVEVFDDRYADLVTTDGGDVVDDLRAAMPDVELRGFPEMDRQHLDGGLVGFLAYDAVYDLWLDEVGMERPDSRFPDAQFVLTTSTLRFDHAEGAVELVFTPVVRADEDAGARYDELVAEAERVETALSTAETLSTGGFSREAEVAGPKDEYEDAVRTAKEYVLSGDIYQGVISRTRELYGDIDPLGLYAALREVNPSPYMYLLGHDDLSIVGASPETLVSVAGDRVVSNPIAGTCPRGNSPVEDRRLAGEMLADGKERAEHTMLVDLARNDVRRVSEAGSVRVEEFMNVLKYSHVQHIESTVTGTLAPEQDAFDAARATFPAGTLSGAPKIRSMEIIDELERSPRGPYGGGVGYFDWGGDTDFAIVIRSATVEEGVPLPDDDEPVHDRVTVQAGAGIVADSDPESEYIETEQKMDGVLAAVERIEREGGAADSTVADEPEVSR